MLILPTYCTYLPTYPRTYLNLQANQKFLIFFFKNFKTTEVLNILYSMYNCTILCIREYFTVKMLNLHMSHVYCIFYFVLQ